MKIFLSRLACAAVLVALVPGVPRAEEALDDVTMAVPTFSLSFSLGYIAEDAGFFAKHGLRVKALEIQGLGAINAVISGSSDFAEPSAASLARAASHGQRLLAIAEILDRPVVQIALRKDLAEAGGFDPKAPLATRALLLKGRTIAVDSINSVVHAYVRLVARRAGFDPENIRVAPMQPANMIAAFAAGQIDGLAMSPPWPQKPVLEGSAVMIASGPDGDPPDLVPFANTVLVTRAATCERRKATCAAMGHAFADAAAFMQDHPQEAQALLKKRFPTLDDPLLAAAFAVIRKITPSPPVVTRDGLENVEKFNVDSGLLPRGEALQSFDGLYTDAYLR